LFDRHRRLAGQHLGLVAQRDAAEMALDEADNGASGESVANHHPLPPTGQGRRGTRFVNEKPLVGLNRCPPDMPEFRTATTAYYAAMEAMTTRLVPIVAMALDLPLTA
jgi:isopenicillin N synthase-like dioxygenase